MKEDELLGVFLTPVVVVGRCYLSLGMAKVAVL